MEKVSSIKQNTQDDTLPNFRNLTVILRILLISMSLGLCQVMFLSRAWAEVPLRMVDMAMLFAPALLITLLLLWLAQPFLKQISYWRGILVTQLIIISNIVLCFLFQNQFVEQTPLSHFDLLRFILFGLMTSSVILTYFRLRTRLLSNAMNEARLQMLRARIRPHFFFNCINAVLGVVRAQPKKAETALEDMADLFRMAMADAKDFVPLHQEVELCRQYAALETLRMGDRLKIEWQFNDIPDDALIPPLLLQPLLENAVYHGIESLSQGGAIHLTLSRNKQILHITVENPCAPREHQKMHAGNKMALQNIRERLELLFDSDARYQVESRPDLYRVEITMPYLKESNL